MRLSSDHEVDDFATMHAPQSGDTGWSRALLCKGRGWLGDTELCRNGSPAELLWGPCLCSRKDERAVPPAMQEPVLGGGVSQWGTPPFGFGGARYVLLFSISFFARGRCAACCFTHIHNSPPLVPPMYTRRATCRLGLLHVRLILLSPAALGVRPRMGPCAVAATLPLWWQRRQCWSGRRQNPLAPVDGRSRAFQTHAVPQRDPEIRFTRIRGVPGLYIVGNMYH